MILLLLASSHNWNDRSVSPCLAIGWEERGLMNFLVQTHSTMVLLISIIKVAGITSVSHQHQVWPFFFFWWGWCLNPGLHTCRCSTTWNTPPVHFALVILETESHKLFPWAGLEPLSSWSQAPKWLQLQVWATSTQLYLSIYHLSIYPSIYLYISVWMSPSAFQHCFVVDLYRGSKESKIRVWTSAQTQVSCLISDQ
jgi:hypothetical protein